MHVPLNQRGRGGWRGRVETVSAELEEVEGGVRRREGKGKGEGWGGKGGGGGEEGQGG